MTEAPPEGYTVVQEGSAKVLQRGDEVFYNPAMVVNRDLSIAALREFIKLRDAEIASGTLKKHRRKCDKDAFLAQRAADEVAGITKEYDNYDHRVRILEGLAATGLRAIRYANEVGVEGRIKEIVANDMDPCAVTAMRKNIDYTGGTAKDLITLSEGNACVTMLTNELSFDVVDLDPYGAPVRLLDSAVQAVTEGGLLMVTATDMAVLCGNNGEACWAKYASYPIHRYYCHEQAVRIVLSALEQHANRYKRRIVPLLSVHMDYYVRVFVRLYTAPGMIKDSPSQRLAYIYQSSGCDSFVLSPVGTRTPNSSRPGKTGTGFKYSPGHGPAVPEKCTECGSRFLVGGPIWSGPLHDPTFCQNLQESLIRDKAKYPAFELVNTRLTNVREELVDVPLFVNIHEACKTVHCPNPKMDLFRSALANAGYRVSSTHMSPLGVKTDAPWPFIWDVVRQWVKENPLKNPPEESSYAAAILNKPITHPNISFARNLKGLSQSRLNSEARFLPNPTEHWGPKRRAGTSTKPAAKNKAENGGDRAGEDEHTAAQPHNKKQKQ